MPVRTYNMTTAHVNSQIHVPVVSFDTTQKFMVISDIHENLCVAFDGLVQDIERPGFQIRCARGWVARIRRHYMIVSFPSSDVSRIPCLPPPGCAVVEVFFRAGCVCVYDGLPGYCLEFKIFRLSGTLSHSTTAAGLLPLHLTKGYYCDAAAGLLPYPLDRFCWRSEELFAYLPK